MSIAKNYLSEEHIRRLERTVTGYFDYIEDLIERENTFNHGTICRQRERVFGLPQIPNLAGQGVYQPRTSQGTRRS